MNRKNKKRIITLVVGLALVFIVGSIGYTKWKEYSGVKISTQGFLIESGKSSKSFTLENNRKYLDLTVNVEDVSRLDKSIKVKVYNPSKEVIYEYDFKGDDILTKITLEGKGGEWTLEFDNEEGKACGVSFDYKYYNVK